ncbi:tetratricopeptide repeat protein [Allopusillimonas soli]|uniref:Tetratricopeptide repeat protein n=1 Tax=Allopusillimonas soli TaxID=659016 RepID=A0A853FFN7_9BURK|nr:tetratricopeptide repeat protein [Allopusillimonas soli]NYT38689.1 tetratricopeptide repeat protein [Allopusillimonas soli]TEA71607.1 tetratricopeptide repeat protein [Allopusillimonas soli]
MTLLLGSWPLAMRAQTPVPGLVPHVDLNASVDAGPDFGAFDPSRGGVTAAIAPAPSTGKLFEDAPREEGGWKGLARLLEALEPNVDTSIPLTASQITDRISGMLDQGQAHQALDVIEKREAQLKSQGGIGTDVQLMFLHARALSAVGRHDDAVALYLKMTTLYPELPEPWNNLAAEYVRQGKLDMARDALTVALQADPGYATAQANLGEVQLMLAERSFRQAGASRKANQAAEILKH